MAGALLGRRGVVATIAVAILFSALGVVSNAPPAAAQPLGRSCGPVCQHLAGEATVQADPLFSAPDVTAHAETTTVKFHGEYLMYYRTFKIRNASGQVVNCVPGGTGTKVHTGFGLARSADGNKWTVDNDGLPIASLGRVTTCPAVRGTPTQITPSISPNVMLDSDGALVMVYNAYNSSANDVRIVAARSTDGVNWTVLSNSLVQRPAGSDVGTPDIIKQGSEYFVTFHYYVYATGAMSRAYVRTTDLHASNLPMQHFVFSGKPWFTLGIGLGDIIREDNIYYMVFEGFNGDARCGFANQKNSWGFASSTDLVHWTLAPKPVLPVKYNCGHDMPAWQVIDGIPYVVTTGYDPTSKPAGRPLGTVTDATHLARYRFYAPFQGEMLKSASFETGVTGWTAGGLRWTRVSRADAPDGHTALDVVQTAKTGVASMTQSVAVPLKTGQSYTLSAWVRTAPGSTPTSGHAVLALWDIGDPAGAENTNADFTVNSAWRQVRATLEVRKTKATSLKVQLWIPTTGTVEVDGMSLTANGLSQASFETGFGAWSFSANAQISAVSNAPDGHSVLNTNLGSGPTGSAFSQTVAASVQPGQSYTLSAWVRVSIGTSGIGRLALFGLGAHQVGENSVFAADENWKRVSTTLEVNETGDTLLKAQVFLDSRVGFQFDGMQLTANALKDASFETSTEAWRTGGNVTAQARTVSDAADGNTVLAANVASPGATVTQDIDNQLLVGQSYTASAWIRTTNGSPQPVTLALWGLGSITAKSDKAVVVNGTWQRVSTTFEVTQAGMNRLRVQAFLYGSTEFQIDGMHLSATTPNYMAG